MLANRENPGYDQVAHAFDLKDIDNRKLPGPGGVSDACSTALHGMMSVTTCKAFTNVVQGIGDTIN